MSYSNLIQSNVFPTDSPIFKQLAEPTITAKDGNKIVESRIEWNSKNYTFRWCCDASNSDDNIKNELKNKIDIMLVLGVRYGIGHKISALKYNLADQTIVRTSKHNNPEHNPSEPKALDFDKKLHRLEKKFGAAKTAEASQPEDSRPKTKKYDEKQKVIAWSKKMFAEIQKRPSQITSAPRARPDHLQIDRQHRSHRHHHHRQHGQHNPVQQPMMELIDPTQTSPDLLEQVNKEKKHKTHHHSKKDGDAATPLLLPTVDNQSKPPTSADLRPPEVQKLRVEEEKK